MELFYLLGNLTFLVLVFLMFAVIIGAILILINIATKRTYLPGVISLLIAGFESPIKSLFAIMGIESKAVDQMEVDMRNKLNKNAFEKTEYKDRLLLLPQCLRHSQKCPARVVEDGFECVGCGQCDIKEIKQRAEKLGYRVSVVPGGTFAQRMIKKYKPKAVIGVGCMFELKEGLNMCAKMGVPALGVQLLKSGCVNTVLNLQELYDALDMKGEVA